MKTLVVINSACLEKYGKRLRDEKGDFKWDYIKIINNLTITYAPLVEVLFFHPSYISEQKKKFYQVLDIEHSVKIVSAPINRLGYNCKHCGEELDQYEHSIYDTTIACHVLLAIINGRYDVLRFVGLDRQDISVVRAVRNYGVSVHADTFSKIQSIASKANCSLGLDIIDDNIEDYIMR